MAKVVVIPGESGGKEHLTSMVDHAVSHLLLQLGNSAIIDGGNFQIREGQYLTHPLATATFEAAASIIEKTKDLDSRVDFGFLIDNFSIRDSEFNLPSDYLEILENHEILPGDITYFKESNLRNRAHRRLKTILAEEDSKYEIARIKNFTADPPRTRIYMGPKGGDPNIEVARMHITLGLPTPLGSMLLAEGLFKKEKMGYEVAVNLMHEGSYVVKDGSHADLYHLLGGKMQVFNIYFRERGDRFEMDITRYDAPIRMT